MTNSAIDETRLTVAATLKEGWLTADLSGGSLDTLAAMATLERHNATEVLLRESELSTYLAVVLEGRVALRLRVPERGPVTILTVEPGDVLAWSALVPPYRATSTAVALVETTLVKFDAARLREALARDTTLATELYPVMLRAVARRLEGTRAQLLDLFSQRWVEPW